MLMAFQERLFKKRGTKFECLHKNILVLYCRANYETNSVGISGDSQMDVLVQPEREDGELL